MFFSDLNPWRELLAQEAAGLVRGALIFACLAMWLHRKDLRSLITRAMPRSLRFNILSVVFDTVLILTPVAYASASTQHFLQDRGLVLLDGQLFSSLPYSVVALLAVFLGDFIGYLRHRLEHSRLLWPAHVMHHSDTDMHWLTLHRFHPLNRLTTVIIDSSALVALGFPPWAIVFNGLFRHYYGMFIHANVPWTYGRLGAIFVSPAMHRWHHVREGLGVGSNFATVFCIFDRAFGTFHLPGPCYERLGVPDVDNDAFLRQLALPVTRLLALMLRRTELRRSA